MVWFFGLVFGGLGILVVFVGVLFVVMIGIVGVIVVVMGLIFLFVMLWNNYFILLVIGIIVVLGILG